MNFGPSFGTGLMVYADASFLISLSDFEKDMRDGIFLLRPLPDQVFVRFSRKIMAS